MANINEDEGKNPQYEQLESWADSSGSEYPGNLGEKEDQQALEVESVWVVDQRAVGKDTDQVSRPENRSERRQEREGWQILLLFLHCKLQSLPDLLHGDKLDGTFLHDEFPGGGVDDSRLGKPRAESHMLHPSLLGYLVVTSEMEK